MTDQIQPTLGGVYSRASVVGTIALGYIGPPLVIRFVEDEYGVPIGPTR